MQYKLYVRMPAYWYCVSYNSVDNHRIG